jgi:drug/metabolite transporter (DMT)-like permease
VANKIKAYTYPVLVLAMIFWGFSFIGVKIVFKYLSPTATVFLRLIIASVFLIGLSLIIGKLQKIQKRDIGTFLLLALFEPFLYYLGEGYGINLVSPTVASIVISTIPLFLPFSMYLLAKEKIALGNYFGVLVSFIGVLLVVLNGNLSFDAAPEGIFYLMIAVASVMGYSYVLQKLSSRYNAYTIISTQNFIGIFYFLPLFLYFDASTVESVQWNAELLITLISLAVLASAMAFFLFTLGIQQIGVTRATVFTYIIPVITAVASFFILREEFSMRKITGILLTIGGLFLSQIPFRRFFGDHKNSVN